MPPSSFDARLAGPSTPAVIVGGKKSKKKLFVIVALIVALLIGAAAAGFVFWYQNPDKMLSDGIVQTLQAKTTSYRGTFGADSSTMHLKVDLDGVYDTGAQNINANVVLSYGSVDYKVKGSVLIDKNTDVYLKIANLESIVAPLRAMVPEKSYDTFDKTVKKLDGKWIKINATELATYNPGFAKAQSCTSNAVQQTENNTPLLKEIEDNYKKNPFIKAGEKLGDKNGSTGFVLAVDQTKAKLFAVALKETQAYKTLHDCDSSFAIDENTFFKDMATDNTVRTEVWVNTWTHQVTTFAVNSESKDGGFTTALSLNPTFNTPVTIQAPSDAITLKDLQSELETLQQQTMMPTGSKASDTIQTPKV